MKPVTIACPHWQGTEGKQSGACALGYFGGRPNHLVCLHICQLGRLGDPGTASHDPAPAHGPGTELKRLLAIFGIVAVEGCQCDAMAARMNRWGAEGCREHLEEIVATMRAEAAIRGLPFSALIARGLIRRAIAASADPPA